MSERSEARIPGNPWLERLAWNAAALAALAVMLLVLLGSLEWLDRLAAASRGTAPVAPAVAAAAPAPQTLACASEPRAGPTRRGSPGRDPTYAGPR